MIRFLLAIVLWPMLLLGHEKFILITTPKCGSHLIIHILNEILQKEDQRQLRSVFPDFLHELAIAEKNNTYLSTHQPCTPEAAEYVKSHGYKVIFILRDPRDQLVSLMHYNQRGYWPQLPMNHLSHSEQITELITGNRFGFHCYEESFVDRLGWKDLGPDITYVTTFEKLIGYRGGGSDTQQKQEILNIAEHIGITLSPQDCERIAKRAYGKGFTFRKGMIGSWKSHFTLDHVELFKLLYGQELIDLGYEQDFNW